MVMPPSPTAGCSSSCGGFAPTRTALERRARAAAPRPGSRGRSVPGVRAAALGCSLWAAACRFAAGTAAAATASWPRAPSPARSGFFLLGLCSGCTGSVLQLRRRHTRVMHLEGAAGAARVGDFLCWDSGAGAQTTLRTPRRSSSALLCGGDQQLNKPCREGMLGG